MADVVARGETRAEARARGARNARIRLKMYAAREAGDEAEEARLFAMQLFSAANLAACKNAFGAEWIRESKLDTRLADAEFGPGWLDEAEDGP